MSGAAESRAVGRAAFRSLLRDPVFWVAAGLYLLGRFVLRPVTDWSFVHRHWNDVLCVPLCLPPLVAAATALRLRSGGRPRGPEIAVCVVVWSWWFEGVAPRHGPLVGITFADPWDVVCYTLGALVAERVWRADAPFGWRIARRRGARSLACLAVMAAGSSCGEESKESVAALENLGSILEEARGGCDWWAPVPVTAPPGTSALAERTLRSGSRGTRLTGAVLHCALIEAREPSFVEDLLDEPGDLGERLLGSWWGAALLDRPESLDEGLAKLATSLRSHDARRRRIACWAAVLVTTEGLERALAHPIHSCPSPADWRDESPTVVLERSEESLQERYRTLCETFDRKSLAERHRAFAVRSLAADEASWQLRFTDDVSRTLWLAYLHRLEGLFAAWWSSAEERDAFDTEVRRAADPASEARLFRGIDLLRLHDFTTE